MSNKIVFLDYLSRAGSTLLAMKLAEFENVEITPEPRFLKGYDPSKLNVQNPEELENYLDYLYHQQKFLNWHIDRRAFEHRLNALPFPLRFNHFFQEIISLAYPNHQEKTIVVKGGGNYWLNIAAYTKLLPEMEILFIVRDPRGMYNSQKKSIDSLRNKPMQQNILRFVAKFRDVTRNIRDSRYAKHVQIVRYESLIDDEQNTLNNVLNMMQGIGAKKDAEAHYFDQIPEEQKHLHQNIRSGEAIQERKSAWKSELSKSEIGAIEYLLRDEMKYWNYPLQFNGKLRPGFAICIFKHFINRTLSNVKVLITGRK